MMAESHAEAGADVLVIKTAAAGKTQTGTIQAAGPMRLHISAALASALASGDLILEHHEGTQKIAIQRRIVWPDGRPVEVGDIKDGTHLTLEFTRNDFAILVDGRKPFSVGEYFEINIGDWGRGFPTPTRRKKSAETKAARRKRLRGR